MTMVGRYLAMGQHRSWDRKTVERCPGTPSDRSSLQDKQVVGGLGVSGDTACADHESAKRVRHLAGLTPPGGALADDINYGAVLLRHALCHNTVKNGVFVGNEGLL